MQLWATRMRLTCVSLACVKHKLSPVPLHQCLSINLDVKKIHVFPQKGPGGEKKNLNHFIYTKGAIMVQLWSGMLKMKMGHSRQLPFHPNIPWNRVGGFSDSFEGLCAEKHRLVEHNFRLLISPSFTLWFDTWHLRNPLSYFISLTLINSPEL